MRTAADLSAAVRATLEQHYPAQLGALARPLPVPSTYAEVPTRDVIRRVKDVSVAISVPGLVAPPLRRSDGTWTGTFGVLVALFHTNTPLTPLFTATHDYGMAAVATLMQHPSLGGFAEWTTWTNLSADPMGDEISPSLLGLSVAEFSVSVPGLFDEDAPPPPGAPSGWDSTGPTVLSAEVQFTDPPQ